MYKPEGKSTDKPKAVTYFNHFPNNFLKPYGLADNSPPEDTVFKRLSPMNCEWLLRPKIAASEFAHTIEENLNYLASTKSPILKSNKFILLQQKLQEFIPVLEKLNTKTNTKGDATAEDVKTFLKTMIGDDEDMDAFFAEMFRAGGAMYLMGVHYTIAKTLLTNPQWYAKKAVGDSKQLRQFKQDPSIKGLKNDLTETCTASSTQPKEPGLKRNLAALLDSDDDDQHEASKGKQKKKAKKQKKSKK